MFQLFSLLAQHMWNSILMKAIGKDICLVVHFGPVTVGAQSIAPAQSIAHGQIGDSISQKN
jgi:hypothetical protein